MSTGRMVVLTQPFKKQLRTSDKVVTRGKVRLWVCASSMQTTGLV
jgi:hypothetical protein